MICYHRGDQNAGDAHFDTLQRRAQKGYVSPMFLAWLHLARGEPEDALRRTAEALVANDPWVSSHRLMCPAIVPAEPLVDDLLSTALP
jgi:hypothetical protein